MSHSLAVLTTVFQFGGMTLYSLVSPLFLFKVMAAPAGATLRLAFPWFYLFIVVTAAVAVDLTRYFGPVLMFIKGTGDVDDGQAEIRDRGDDP